MMQQTKSKNIWILFGVFSLLLAAKCILFHWSAFHSILISSLWKAPLDFFKFYMPKLLTPMFIASFIFISKRLWWTWVVALLTDIWCIANSIYYKVNDSFITINEILMVGNMRGFWSSIIIYLDWTMAIILLLTIVWIGVLFLFHNGRRNRNWKTWLIVIVSSVAVSCVNNNFAYNAKYLGNIVEKEVYISQTKSQYFFKFYYAYWSYNYKKNATNNFCGIQRELIYRQTILDDFVYVILSHLYLTDKPGEIISLNDSDIKAIHPLISNISSVIPSSNLIIILVEGMESWPLLSDILAPIVTPYLSKLLVNNHVSFFENIKSQALSGRSSDGQMTINTGLLPIQNGAAVMKYPDNIYPNIAGMFAASCIVNPSLNCYNQDTMSVRYGYLISSEPTNETWQDEHIFSQSLQHMNDLSYPSCMQVITISMHAPFTISKNIPLNTDAPGTLDAYLKCYHYTDSCLGVFVDSILANPALAESTTIVITGDHTCFNSTFLNSYHDYAVRHNLSFASGESYCPLIIYSPKIEKNEQIHDLCYQMDIFPTILHLIDCESYFWHGFGVNLLDSVARNNRTISEEEAYRLSDLIIRSDYFRNYYHIEQ